MWSWDEISSAHPFTFLLRQFLAELFYYREIIYCRIEQRSHVCIVTVLNLLLVLIAVNINRKTNDQEYMTGLTTVQSGSRLEINI